MTSLRNSICLSLLAFISTLSFAMEGDSESESESENENQLWVTSNWEQPYLTTRSQKEQALNSIIEQLNQVITNIQESELPISSTTKASGINALTIYKNMAEKCLQPDSTIDTQEFFATYASEEDRLRRMVELLDKKRKESKEIALRKTKKSRTK